MKIERVIIIVALVGVVFVGTISLFVYKIFSPGKAIAPSGQNEPWQLAEPLDRATSTPNSGTTNTNGTGSLSESDTHNVIDDCTELKSYEAQGKEYERGSIIVTFFETLGYETAVDSIEYFNLKPDISASGKSNFDLYHWLTVTVPRGEEFKWQCVLGASEGVKKTNLNFTFKLRQ